ncbi:MAG: tetratricopeptide repeat protein [Magnetospirillum sp.]|nr:tetratricopeptide repeat protein [Magnetospirillum sp.]
MNDPRLLWQKAKDHLDKKRPRAALPLLMRLAEAVQGDPAVHFNLGCCCLEVGRYDDAVSSFGKTVRLAPAFPSAYRMLGRALLRAGQSNQAEPAFAAALAQAPGDETARIHLARLLAARGKDDDAARLLNDSAVCSEPVGVLLAEVLIKAERPLEALGALDRLGDAPTGTVLRAHAEMAAGHTEAAATLFRHLATRAPNDTAAGSAALMADLYLDNLSAEDVAARHLAWGRRIAGQVKPMRSKAPRPRSGRRLRIGYLSPDFCYHAVAKFFVPIVTDHDRTAFEIFCYANVAKPDDMTHHIEGLADHWLPVADLSDDDVARRIARDEIDILIDLAGHSAGNRLPVFARKPAPVQVAWLGYPATTGLTAIDYQIADSVVLPPHEDPCQRRSERPLRLPSGFHRFHPLGQIDPGVDRPADRPFTFASFNALSKISPTTVRLWSRALHAIPESQMLIKRKALADSALQQEIRARFHAEGIDGARVVFASSIASNNDHLAHYRAADVVLDCVPYNGTTTTCDALWMGIPVVTLLGDRHCCRMSASLLTQIGASEWIARDEGEFIAIVRRLAATGRRTAEGAHALRTRFLASSLGSGTDIVRNLETALIGIWEEKFR